jgi:hypothetical protein
MNAKLVVVALLGAPLLAACDPSARSQPPAGATANAAGSVQAAAAPLLRPGDVAKPFRLQGSDGKMHALADDLGKRAVVVAWFPKAFTGG